MFGRTKRAPVPVAEHRGRPWRALAAAIGVAVLVTVGAMASVSQAMKQQQKTLSVWVTTALIPGGSRIASSDVKSVQVPEAAASLLYSGPSPVGRSATVTVLAGSALSQSDVGGKAVAIPAGDIGVWVATTPGQDGALFIGQTVLPYAVPQAGSSGPSQAQTLTSGPVQVVAISSQSGAPIGSVGAAAGLTGFNAPAAVELAVPSKAAAAVLAAVAAHTVILAVPGGGR